MTLVMAVQIKLFLCVQTFSKNVAITPIDQNQNRLKRSKRMFILIFITQILILMVTSGVFAASSLYELSLSFYLCTTTMVMISLYVLSIFHYDNIVKLIEKFEQFIEKSKLKYKKNVHFIEK